MSAHISIAGALISVQKNSTDEMLISDTNK